MPFRETYIRFDYKQQETFSETEQFFENIVIESNSSFLKYYKNGNKKENKKFRKGCLKLSEHTLYLQCFICFLIFKK